jgi:23S rRNA pseudouridine1911/1915/1917 synthase
MMPIDVRRMPLNRDWRIAADDADARLDKFLASAERLGSRARALAALERGKIFLNGRETGPEAAGVRLAAGDRVRIWMDRPGTSSARRRAVRDGDLRILFEDEALLVVDKPAGILAVPLPRKPAESIVSLLADHFRSRGKHRPLVVHRIDRDTSGLVVFVKDARSQAALKAQFLRREPERVYWAVVYGHPEPPRGTWRDHLVWDTKALIQKAARPGDPGASEAISDYRVIESFRDASLLEVRLRTGRRNQIRLQARLRGHTLVGERRYVDASESARRVPFERQALHARQLSFMHPVDGRRLTFDAPPPPDFLSLLERLRRQR